MSIKALNWAWQQCPSSKTAKLVLVSLADSANDHGECWHLQGSIAEKCKPLSSDGVRRALRVLEEEKFIEKKQRRSVGRFSAMDFSLPIHRDALVPPGENDRRAEVHDDRSALVRDGVLKEVEPKELTHPTGAAKRRDDLWDALVRAMRTAAPVTRSGRGAWNRALKELREADATPTLLLAAAENYRKRWPDVELTPTALAKHWHVFALEAKEQSSFARAETWTRKAGYLLGRDDFEALLSLRDITDDECVDLSLLYEQLRWKEAA